MNTIRGRVKLKAAQDLGEKDFFPCSRIYHARRQTEKASLMGKMAIVFSLQKESATIYLMLGSSFAINSTATDCADNVFIKVVFYLYARFPHVVAVENFTL